MVGPVILGPDESVGLLFYQWYWINIIDLLHFLALNYKFSARCTVIGRKCTDWCTSDILQPVVCRTQTLSIQSIIAFSISAHAERVWCLEYQNLVQYSPVVWWVLNIFKEVLNVVIVNLRYHWRSLLLKSNTGSS